MCGRPQKKFYHSIFAFASIFHNTRGKKTAGGKKAVRFGGIAYSRRVCHISPPESISCIQQLWKLSDLTENR